MRKDLLTLTLAPLLLVSCSCSHREASPAAHPSAPASAPSAATGSASAASPVDATIRPVNAADASNPADPGQTLRVTVLDARSRAGVYHAGLSLAGSKSLQWTDRQGRYAWSGGGFPSAGSIEIRCPALRAEVGRKLKTLAYELRGQTTALEASIDAAACIEPPETSSPGPFAGTFFPYYGHGAFVPCAGMPAAAAFYGNAKAAWVNLSAAADAQMGKLRGAAGIDAGSERPLHIEGSGTLIGPGGYGTQGAFAYRLEVDTVASASASFPEGCPQASLP
ncbi:MAG: hypothetical protein JSS44_13995 [Proteobacteria bacterium]|nr:hypothetical protein [Pseudomonadota bacterium]MBS0461932.1 hypothetical protein [Pseudomonadota bacterium]MBS0464364.1 hypothetical protein [Pseudomonadota bacterium]